MSRLMDSIDRLNDLQRQAVMTTEGPLLIAAGAGSGKTRCLLYTSDAADDIALV